MERRSLGSHQMLPWSAEIPEGGGEEGKGPAEEGGGQAAAGQGGQGPLPPDPKGLGGEVSGRTREIKKLRTKELLRNY